MVRAQGLGLRKLGLGVGDREGLAEGMEKNMQTTIMGYTGFRA